MIGPALKQWGFFFMLLVLKFRSGLQLTLDDRMPIKIECSLCDHSVSGPAEEAAEAHNTHCRSTHTVEQLEAVQPVIEVER